MKFFCCTSPDDLSDAKNQLADMNRRLHELELELRRLENEREELAAAYKEAEAVNIYFSLYTLHFNIFGSNNSTLIIRTGPQDRGTACSEIISRVESDAP